MTTVGTRTQSDLAEFMIDDLMRSYPDLARIRDGLTRVVDQAQNPRPAGESDGTISAVRWTQLAEVNKALSSLLLALLFREHPGQIEVPIVNVGGDFPDDFFDP